MKLPEHKGKFALIIIYLLFVFVTPFYTAYTSDPEKVSGLIQGFVSEKDNQFFKNYISLLEKQDTEQAYALFSPEAKQAVTQSQLSELATQFANATNDIQILGAITNTVYGNNVTSYRMTYEIANNDSEKKYLITEIVARDRGDGIKIDGTYMNFSATSVKEGARFAFPKPDITMVLAILAPLFIAYTAFRYFTKASKPKWWPLIGIILLAAFLTIRSDGGFTITFGLYPFLNPAGLWGPWVYVAPIPVGALAYYIFRKKFESPISNP